MQAKQHVETINRHYLHEIVAERLRELVRNGELEPNERLNEIELCARFGTSRTPLREAIKLLAAEGMFELLPNRGARVASLSEEEIKEIIEVVAALEATAAEMACKHITAEEISNIEELHNEMVKAWQKGDSITYYTLNRDIHQAIVEASRNNILLDIYLKLNGKIQHARYTTYNTKEQRSLWDAAIEEHNIILTLLKARAGAELAIMMRKHIRNKRGLAALSAT